MHCQILFFMFYFIIYYNDFVKPKTMVGVNVVAVPDDEHKYVVGLIAMNPYATIEDNLICSGSLIANTHVLLSEHCFYLENSYPLMIVGGTSNLYTSRKYFPLWVLTYDYWATSRNITIISENDIAVLKTIEGLPASLGIVFIPTRIFYRNIVGTTLVMLGWGVSDNNQAVSYLQAANVTIISNIQCTAVISNLAGEWIIIPSHKMLCSNAVPFVLMRNGDSGGPIMLGNVILGINKATSPRLDGNIHPDKINIHIRLDLYLDFLAAMLLEN